MSNFTPLKPVGNYTPTSEDMADYDYWSTVQSFKKLPKLKQEEFLEEISESLEEGVDVYPEY